MVKEKSNTNLERPRVNFVTTDGVLVFRREDVKEDPPKNQRPKQRQNKNERKRKC